MNLVDQQQLYPFLINVVTTSETPLIIITASMFDDYVILTLDDAIEYSHEIHGHG